MTKCKTKETEKGNPQKAKELKKGPPRIKFIKSNRNKKKSTIYFNFFSLAPKSPRSRRSGALASGFLRGPALRAVARHCRHTRLEETQRHEDTKTRREREKRYERGREN